MNRQLQTPRQSLPEVREDLAAYSSIRTSVKEYSVAEAYRSVLQGSESPHCRSLGRLHRGNGVQAGPTNENAKTGPLLLRLLPALEVATPAFR